MVIGKSWTEDRRESTDRHDQRMRDRSAYENKEMIKRKPSPTSACDDNMLRVVVLDSTHTQMSSKYFLFSETTKLISNQSIIR